MGNKMENLMRIIILAVAMTLYASFVPSTSLAEADGPDFFRVTGVLASDVLNIREAANARTRKVGTIPPDTNGIRNLGCEKGLSFADWEKATEAERKSAAKRRWCKVEYNGVVGWVSGRFLTEGTLATEQDDEPGFAWRLLSVGDARALGQGEIVFTPDGSVFGSTGCNRFNGSILAERDKINFHGPLATTRMVCPGDLEAQEGAILKALTGTLRVSYNPVIDQMVLKPVDGAPTLRFQRLR